MKAEKKSPPRVAAGAKKSAIGKRIQALRLEHRETQGELAKKAGKSRVIISKIEGGSIQPSIEFLQFIKDTYHTSYDYLLDGVVPREANEVQETLYRQADWLRQNNDILQKILENLIAEKKAPTRKKK